MYNSIFLPSSLSKAAKTFLTVNSVWCLNINLTLDFTYNKFYSNLARSHLWLDIHKTLIKYVLYGLTIRKRYCFQLAMHLTATWTARELPGEQRIKPVCRSRAPSYPVIEHRAPITGRRAPSAERRAKAPPTPRRYIRRVIPLDHGMICIASKFNFPQNIYGDISTKNIRWNTHIPRLRGILRYHRHTVRSLIHSTLSSQSTGSMLKVLVSDLEHLTWQHIVIVRVYAVHCMFRSKRKPDIPNNNEQKYLCTSRNPSFSRSGT